MKLKNILTGTLLVAGLAGTFGCKSQSCSFMILGQVKGESFYDGQHKFLIQHKFPNLCGSEAFSFCHTFTSKGDDALAIDALIDKGDWVRVDVYNSYSSDKDFKINKENIIKVNDYKIYW